MKVSGQIHAPVALVMCTFGRRLRGSQNRYEQRGEEKTLLFLLGIDHQSPSPQPNTNTLNTSHYTVKPQDRPTYVNDVKSGYKITTFYFHISVPN
jgi:hypothetical protein